MNSILPDKLSDFPELNMPPRILLGPGPSMVPARVLEAMSTPLVGHLDPCFLEMMNRTQALLRYTFETDNPLTIPVSGTGSAAMEASVASLVEPGDKVLVCVNGYFGGRIAEMARRHGGDVQTIECAWGDILSPVQVKEALRVRPAKVVAIVQAETSTGAMQPLEEIAEIVHGQGGIFLVDAVTSLGGISVGVKKQGIDVCYSATQKCLSCPPGLGPVTVNSRAQEVMQKRKSPVSAWYLDLTLVKQYWGPERTYHHTAPISSNFALYEGLRLVAEEGLENRWKRHGQNAEMLWEGLGDLKLKLHVPKAHRLPTLTTVRVPEGIDEASIRRRLLDEYNIEIAGGFGELKGKVWRIGLMGFSSRRENVLVLLSALEKLLRS
jgi:alanine-glyoxylate transaminase/serine-glyoxylate transaminase/serine-pyruvate transaminase